MKPQYGDVSVTLLDNHVAICEIKRGPNNFFDQDLIRDLADAFVDIDADVNARAIVLCRRKTLLRWRQFCVQRATKRPHFEE